MKRVVSNVRIDENDLRFTLEVDDTGTNYYAYNGDIVYPNANIIFDFPYPVMVSGKIRSKGHISSRGDMGAGDLIVAGHGIFSQGDIFSAAGIHSGGGIIGHAIITNGSIYAKNSIEASGEIKAEGDITADRGGIRSGFSIEATKNIFVRSRIFAGMNGYADSKDCQNTIRCEKFRGELGYGILLLMESWGGHG